MAAVLVKRHGCRITGILSANKDSMAHLLLLVTKTKIGHGIETPKASCPEGTKSKIVNQDKVYRCFSKYESQLAS